MTATVQSLASEAYKCFERKTREHGSNFWSLADGHPEWVKDAVYAAHDDMLPDDWKYEFARDAFALLSEHEEEEARERISEDVDIYNGKLLLWVESNLTRASYVEEAADDYDLSGKDFWALLQAGQLREREEVFGHVLAALQERVESLADGEDD